MSTCGCPDSNAHTDLLDLASRAVPVSYVDKVNVLQVGEELFRDGGTPNTNDAQAYGSNWVEGDECAYWQWTITTVGESNRIIYAIVPEDNSVGAYGWFFTNSLVDFRRAELNDGVPGFQVHYRADALGYNNFAIYYNNGQVSLYETPDTATDPSEWIEPYSYSFVTVFNTTWSWHMLVSHS
jgi:hypothetical protein